MNILNIISSPMGQYSSSIRLQSNIVEKLQAQNPGATVTTRDLQKKGYPHLEEHNLAAFFAMIPADSPEYKQAIANSDEAIQELMDADAIVIGVPMYNFSIPSALKAWIDHVVRMGRTFKYNEQGIPEGLVLGKKVYLAISSGAIYSDGPMKPYDFIEPYLRAVFGFIGMTDVTTYRAEGTSIPGIKETAVEKAIESVVV